jgi:hypothetical protein
MPRKRREVEVFSLSFLDCICCGFGAIILLFILTMGANRQVVEESETDLKRTIVEYRAALGIAQHDRIRLSGELAAKEKSLQDIITELAELQALLSKLHEQVQNEAGGKKSLVSEVEDLKREIAAMQKEVPDIPQIDTSKPIGIPVVSNHVAFVIDTSGSMRDPNTELLLGYVTRKFQEVLEAYPQVKGVQFLDADGRFILGRGDSWIPDSSETRHAVIAAVRRYGIASNSNPVPGVVRAIRALYREDDPEMKMGIYIFGDEFTETSEVVLERIDRMNPPGPDGKRPITINAIGFPNLLRAGFSLGQSGVKFANLMRELTTIHGGAFLVVTGDPD